MKKQLLIYIVEGNRKADSPKITREVKKMSTLTQDQQILLKKVEDLEHGKLLSFNFVSYGTTQLNDSVIYKFQFHVRDNEIKNVSQVELNTKFVDTDHVFTLVLGVEPGQITDEKYLAQRLAEEIKNTALIPQDGNYVVKAIATVDTTGYIM